MPQRKKHLNVVQISFGSVIRSLRHKLNLSQEALAEKAGVHRTYIGDLELGGRNISLKNILKLSLALKTTPDQLMKLLFKQLKLKNKSFELKHFLEKNGWGERG